MLKKLKINSEFKGCTIFDFDGTLIDSYTKRNLAHVKVCEILLNYLRESDVKLNQSKMLNIIFDVEMDMTDKKIYSKEIWWPRVLSIYTERPINMDSKIISDISLAYWNTIKDNSFLYPGVINLLNNLKKQGIPLGLLTDTDGFKGMKLKRIANSGLVDYFDSIVVSGEDTIEVKPDKKPFLRITELLGVPPNKCIYIGDRQEVDVVGAKKIGMRTIIIGDDIIKEDYDLLPDYFIKRRDLKCLYKLILSLLK